MNFLSLNPTERMMVLTEILHQVHSQSADFDIEGEIATPGSGSEHQEQFFHYYHPQEQIQMDRFDLKRSSKSIVSTFKYKFEIPYALTEEQFQAEQRFLLKELKGFNEFGEISFKDGI